jgi:hypothetical protein
MLAACLAPHADEWSKLTYFTFSAPVEMPGVVLPAGTYKFELADPDNSRRVVRVSDKESGKVHGTFLSIPNQMLDPAAKPLVMFKEAPAGAPEAVKAWFYRTASASAGDGESAAVDGAVERSIDGRRLRVPRVAEVARVDSMIGVQKSRTMNRVAFAVSGRCPR